MMYSWPMLHAKTMFDPKSEQQYMKAQCMKLMNQIIAICKSHADLILMLAIRDTICL